MSAAATFVPHEMEGIYTPPKRVLIASIYPLDVVTKIARRAPKSEFTIPAGKKINGKWVPGILVVEDTWESKATSTGGLVRILAEHTAQHIVNDQTVHLFRCNAAERAYPGIWQCAGDEPTAEEIADAEGCQRRYFTNLVNAARELERQSKRAEIQPDMYMAARELGIVGESWQNEISKDQQKKCAWCSKFIDTAARKCSHCGEFQSAEDARAAAGLRQAPIVPPVAEQKPAQPTQK